MTKIFRLAVAIVAAVVVLSAAVVFLAGDNRPRPPLSGEFTDFTVASAGSPAPQTALVARDGSETTLQALRGRFVLVNFWATWCAPCVRELPSLARLQTRLGGEAFTVLALSEDLKGWPVIRPFLEKLGLESLPVLHDVQGATSRAMGVSGLPTTVLLDREGREIGRFARAAEWDQPDALALLRFYLEGDDAPP